MLSVFESKEKCCGCTACASACPVNAISMENDECGFGYPKINQSVCVDCGLCKKTCTFQNRNEFELFRESYVAKHKSNHIVDASRSGGFFTAISDIILSDGGVIYGALLDKNLYVRHIRATNATERNSLRESKYVQSDLTGIFCQVKEDLLAGLMVLFTGTGCQCGGLISFLETKHIPKDNLLVCDIVCHSNASPQLFKKYLAYQEEKFGSYIVDYHFRDKDKYPWGSHVEKIVFESGKAFYTDEYTNFFYTDDIRPSCFNCRYTSLRRCGDITIADCWGGDKMYPDIVNDKGASLVLVNTEKGKRYFDKIDSMIIRQIPIDVVMQPRLKDPEQKSATYDTFWEDYKSLPFNQFMKHYSHNNYSWDKVLVSKIKRMVRLPIRAVRKLARRIKND